MFEASISKITTTARGSMSYMQSCVKCVPIRFQTIARLKAELDILISNSMKFPLNYDDYDDRKQSLLHRKSGHLYPSS